MLTQEIIRRKRDRETLTAEQISLFVERMSTDEASPAQIAAFGMAAFLNGMETEETVALTLAMRDSGNVLSWDAEELAGPVLDKHSTGGVGDKVSIMLAPMVAAAGGFVPMISGRGLGHTGGTLDKLDSILGYDTAPTVKRFRQIVAQAGCAIIGQTEDLAPADRRFYAVRDVTATVESIPLITASILSKKLAAGLQGLAMDVKTGSGAFMSNLDDSRALARSIVDVANGAGLPTTALITDMNQVLGHSAGNAVEIGEVVDYLTGERRDERLHEVVIALGAEMLVTGGLAADRDIARAALLRTLASGAAAERFERMVSGLGGPTNLLRETSALRSAPITLAALPDETGTVARIDTRKVGLAVVELGGGRRRAEDRIDHSVGLTEIAGLGDEVGPERPLALVHAKSEADAAKAAETLKQAFAVGDAPEPGPVVVETVTG
ncbi:thymidine phosphorylase [Nisaea acidiphila]|uniref:Thymidine phosphorylase n=1 Tax=Nisaea acidiphila TaxID=1862145 RepID=A0A9J7ALB6_9PROT|nr:thymidine phosphorylase [Nisaea acidiphila]UUX48272.1 thymidine phosphorylase [Nisaea acidiphila]